MPLLEGVRVLDLTRVLSGPFGTQQLVDLGAEVIKIENPTGGDDTRRFGPPFVEGESTYFMSVNRGKKSVAVDLKDPRGLELVRALAGHADVVIENFRPGTAERLGLGLEGLRAAHPHLVTCAISGYGGSGDPRFCARGGYDAVIQAASGLMALTGEPGGAPTKVGVAISDMVAGLYAAQGILAALAARERTGEGHHVEISMQDAMLSLLTYQAGSFFATGEPPDRMGNAHPSICPYETVETKDGPYTLAVGNDAQFARFAQLIGRPELAEDPRFATNQSRVENRAALMAQIAPPLREKTRDEWDAILSAAHIPGGPVLEVPQALEHPQVKARETVLRHSHSTAGEVRTVASPVRFDGAAPAAGAAAPLLGAHTREVLGSRLDLDASTLDALQSAGVIRQS